MGKSTASFLLPLLALIALIVPFSANLRPPSATSGAARGPAFSEGNAPRATSPSGTESSLTGAAKLVADFFDASTSPTTWPDQDPRTHYALDFIIATVPDPIDSRLPYFFDSFLESIQRASEAGGYVLDSFDLAWTVDSWTKGDRSRRSGRFEEEPSVLLFRSSSDRRLLVVFLIGETPTGGVHKAAMASALQQIADFYPWGPGHNKLPGAVSHLTIRSGNVIKLMAPSFSGSADSLEFALRDWVDETADLPGKPQVSFAIVSGTATAINPQQFAGIGDKGKSVFQAVVPPDSEIMQALKIYLREFGVKRIALLSEANTAYGRNTAMLDQSGNRSRNTDTAVPSVLNLPFPLHISELRTASEKQQQQAPKQQATSELPASAPTSIPLPEGTNFAAKETPPFFSPMGVSSAELVLSSLLSTISREEIHTVGILATDAQDTIFLTHEIRAHSPSALIFTFSSDLIFTHPEANPSTQGMLVVTPYPLFDLNQLWSAPFAGNQSRLQFSNQAAEGVYNAMLALLDRPDEMLEYGPPFVSGTAPEMHLPALWVTAIGRGETVPVTVLNWNDSKHYLFVTGPTSPQTGSDAGRHRPTARGVYTTESALVVTLIGLFLITFSLLVIRQYLPPGILRPPGAANWFARLLGDPIVPQDCAQSRLFMLTACSSLFSFFLLVAGAFLLPRVAAYKLGITLALSSWDVVVVIILALCLLAQCTTIILLARAFWRAPRENTRLSAEVKGIVLAGLAAGLCAVLYLASTWVHTAWRGAEYSSRAIFIYLRAFNLASGLSPLVPLFFVAMGAFLWAFCSFRRLRVIDGMRPEGSQRGGLECGAFLGFSTPSFRGVLDLEDQVRDLLENSSVMSTGWYLGLMSVALVAGFYFFLFRLVRTYEGSAFYILFGSCFFLVYWALAMEFVRLWLLWYGLWRLLRRLSWQPLRAAFARYRQSFPGLAKLDLTTPPPTFTVLAFSVDQAERLVRSARALSASSKPPSQRAQDFGQWVSTGEPEVCSAWLSLSTALQADAEGDWRTSLDQRSESQCALARLSPTVAQLLEPRWRSSGSGSAPLEETPEIKSFFELGEEFLVGRAVHFISFVLPSMRNLGAFILAGLLLMLASVSSYHFEPRDQFLLFNWVVILSFVIAALIILVQMERDVVLSALSDTTPGQVTVSRQFVFRILTYVLLPVLAMLGAQFPDMVGQIASVLGVVQGHN